MTIYAIYYADQGLPKTGLSPTFDTFIKKSDGSSLTPPSITELSNGWYKFDYTPSESVLIVIDSNDTKMADIDRYISAELSPEDEYLGRALGLMQENCYIDNQVYTAGKLTSARIRTYDSKANAEAHGATGLVATYTMTATYSGDELTSYLVVKE